MGYIYSPLQDLDILYLSRVCDPVMGKNICLICVFELQQQMEQTSYVNFCKLQAGDESRLKRNYKTVFLRMRLVLWH